MYKELEEINAGFKAGEIGDGIIKFVESRKAHIEKALATPTEEILGNFQSIYDFILNGEKQGLKRKEVVAKVRSEKPEFIDTMGDYPFIEDKVWGYRLKQDISSTK